MKKLFVLIPPAQGELAELPQELQDELLGFVKVLEKNGTLVSPQGDIVDKEKRIFEIRGHDDGQQARILYYYWNGGDLIYGLVACVKKTRETPLKEINLARRRLVQLKKGMWR